jgi:histidine ammonia-lyase
MSPWGRAARKAWRILENAEQVLAIEILAACQALEFHAPLKSSLALETARRFVRRTVPRLVADRVLAVDIRRMVDLLRSRKILEAVTRISGAMSFYHDRRQ